MVCSFWNFSELLQFSDRIFKENPDLSTNDLSIICGTGVVAPGRGVISSNFCWNESKILGNYVWRVVCTWVLSGDRCTSQGVFMLLRSFLTIFRRRSSSMFSFSPPAPRPHPFYFLIYFIPEILVLHGSCICGALVTGLPARIHVEKRDGMWSTYAYAPFLHWLNIGV